MNNIAKLSQSVGNKYLGNNILKKNYNPEQANIIFNNESFSLKNFENTEKNNFIDLISFKQNLILNLEYNYYHFLVDQLPFILIELIKNNNLKIIFINNYRKTTNFHNYVFEKLKEYNVDFLIINLKENEFIKINNYYIYNRYDPNFYNRNENDPELVRNFLKQNKKIIPHRKIYISRKWIENSAEFFADEKKIKKENNYMAYKNFNCTNRRIDNYTYLEIFFEKHNFEIIDDINKFYAFSENFIDQINFFDEVKTLVSLTGSGLTNAIFMQENTNIIELLSTFCLEKCLKLIKNRPKTAWKCDECFSSEFCKEKIKFEHIDPNYFEMCYSLNMNYIAMSSPQKKASNIVEKFLTNPYLLNILNN